ncbi:MAG: 2-oxo acid dehydrogenase subunit E2 [Actinobacteria bacterium]|uniref:Unannotated protein n=1 Tax=freshwater metagenome TaxID=449393 RepID=A0A6J7R4H3_9ZZZZ|nr:2-oxo acid dehydrogenase subunit E2 [Actinomycetota bacterium]
MAIEIRLPQWGMGMLEGEILQWYKKEGDTVAEGEPLAEIEAAKVTADVVAPQAGVLHKIVVHEGKLVPVNELLAYMLGDGDDPNAVLVDSAASAAAAPATAGAAASVAGPATSPAGGGSRNIVPRARMLAKELGVDLALVVGTGPGGRIGEDDVRNAASSSSAAQPEAPGITIPLKGIRGTIARRMVASLQSMAQLTLVSTADVTDLVAHRDAMSERPRPTYTDYIVKAVSLALRQHPGLNATLEPDRIRLLPDVHIGVATAAESGLIVSVVRDADTKSLAQIALDSASVVERVRAGTFSTDDVSGSTFTVTSLGGQGIDAFTPIINPPEAAILGVGRIVDQPARDGDGIAWRKVITLSLTIDHQVVDGAPGAAFLETVVALLADPQTIAQ